MIDTVVYDPDSLRFDPVHVDQTPADDVGHRNQET